MTYKETYAKTYKKTEKKISYAGNIRPASKLYEQILTKRGNSPYRYSGRSL